uniref:Uncharacterized protein n=1 Tax=Aegilops tauschii subsp. strangulata TaxID=200361 RepID=A0A453EVU5_AEGTS
SSRRPRPAPLALPPYLFPAERPIHLTQRATPRLGSPGGERGSEQSFSWIDRYMCDCVCLFLSWLIEPPLRALPRPLGSSSPQAGMARALDGRNGRIKEAARDGGSRALHAVASHGRMPLCVYLLEKHVQRKCQRTFGHSFFLFSQQVSSLSTSICAISNHRSRILNIFLYDIQPVIVQAFV